MARLAALTARAGLSLLGVVGVHAAAAAYPQLHVVALAQRADRVTVEPSGVFHVTLHVKITQRRDRLDELILGSFENCEIISNETVRSAASDGTDFIERLTVQALAPGDATISPAYIDALDPAIGRPMRFSSNAIRVHVSGNAATGSLHTFGEIARRVLLAAAIAAGILAAAFLLVVMFVRRKRRPVPQQTAAPPLVAAPAPADSRTANERLARAAGAYRAEPSDVALLRLRSELFGVAGVVPGATLLDALQALDGRDAELRRALLTAEAATFGPAAQRGAAGEAMLAAIQAYCARRPANDDAWTR